MRILLVMIATIMVFLFSAWTQANGTLSIWTPAWLQLSPVDNAIPSVDYLSDEIMVEGAPDDGWAISVSPEGRYQINGGRFTQGSDTVRNGDTIVVQTTAPRVFSSSRKAVLTIGSYTSEFAVKAQPRDHDPVPFVFEPWVGVEPNTLVQSEGVVISGINDSVAIEIFPLDDWAQYRIGTNRPTSQAGTVSPNDTIELRLRSSRTGNATRTGTITVGNYTTDFSVTSLQNGLTPFSLSSVSNARLEEWYTAPETVVVDADTGSFVVSVLNAEYRVNKGDGWLSWQDTRDRVVVGDQIQVRAQAGNDCNETTSARLTVGDYSTGFDVRTEWPLPFFFQDVDDAVPSTGVESNEIVVRGITTGMRIRGINTFYSINDGPYIVQPDLVFNGDRVRLRMNASNLVGNTKLGQLQICNTNYDRSVTTTGQQGGTQISLDDSFADLVITEIVLDNGTKQVVKDNEVKIRLGIKNVGNVTAKPEVTTYPANFIQCNEIDENGNEWTQVVNSNSFVWPNALTPGQVWYTDAILVGAGMSSEFGRQRIQCAINQSNTFLEGTEAVKNLPYNPYVQNNLQTMEFDVIAQPDGRFDITMDTSISPIRPNLNARINTTRAQGVRDLIMKVAQDVLVPVIIIIGIIVSLFGFYTLMTDTTAEWAGKGVRYIGYGVVGIILMMSTNYLSEVIWGDVFQQGVLTAIEGEKIAETIYDMIVFPFVKLASYIVLGAMFVVLVVHVFQYLTTSGDDVRTRSIRLVIRNVVGMLVILGATSLTEAVFGTRDQVVNSDPRTLGDVGSGLLDTKQIPFVYEVINRVMGLTSFILLVIIIIQTYQMIVDPDNPDNFSKIKRTFLYAFIGIVLIGTGYLITNFVIIQ